MVAEPTPRTPRLFTADEVWRMLEAGILGEDERVELIEGELVTMNAQGPVHAQLSMRIGQRLLRRYGRGFFARYHSPVQGDRASIPEPDVAVVRDAAHDFFDRHPGAADVVLLVEVSSSSRQADRRKAGVYARVGYGAYWIVDTLARCVEVRTAPKGGVYTSTLVVAADGRLDLPGLAAKKRVRVRDLLPPL